MSDSTVTLDLFVTATAILAWLLVIRVDVQRFEIDPIALMAALLLSIASSLAFTPEIAILFDRALGGIIGLLAGAFIHRFMPIRFGRGDVWLIGAFWGIAGTDNIALANLLLLISAAISAWSYSYARGKKPFHSLFPLGLPVGISAIALLVIDGILILGGFNG